MQKTQIFFWALALMFFSISGFALGAGLSGYAWSSNVGWIKFSGPGYGVTMNDTTGDLSGYAWSSNIGWIRFGESGGLLARALGGVEGSFWDGLIKLSGDGYGLTNDQNNCRLTGWAWGSNVVGWIKFSGPGYGVTYPGCAPVNLPSCAFSASPAQVAKGGRSTLIWNCGSTADYCSISGAGVVNAPPSGNIQTGSLLRTTQFVLSCANIAGSADFTTQVRVFRPGYCEVIPFLGTCK